MRQAFLHVRIRLRQRVRPVEVPVKAEQEECDKPHGARQVRETQSGPGAGDGRDDRRSSSLPPGRSRTRSTCTGKTTGSPTLAENVFCRQDGHLGASRGQVLALFRPFLDKSDAGRARRTRSAPLRIVRGAGLWGVDVRAAEFRRFAGAWPRAGRWPGAVERCGRACACCDSSPCRAPLALGSVWR
jgi:hypothetical protein